MISADTEVISCTADTESTKGALHRLNQMVNHLVKCVRVARSPDRRLKLT